MGIVSGRRSTVRRECVVFHASEEVSKAYQRQNEARGFGWRGRGRSESMQSGYIGIGSSDVLSFVWRGKEGSFVPKYQRVPPRTITFGCLARVSGERGNWCMSAAWLPSQRAAELDASPETRLGAWGPLNRPAPHRPPPPGTAHNPVPKQDSQLVFVSTFFWPMNDDFPSRPSPPRSPIPPLLTVAYLSY